MKRLTYVCGSLVMLCIGVFATITTITINGCSTGNGTVKPVVLNPVQVATIACPQLNLLHDQFTAMNSALEADPATAAVGKTGAALLAKVDPINRAICVGVTANPKVTLGNLQDLIKTGLPALGTLAQTLPMTPQQHLAVSSGLAVGETVIAMVNAMVPGLAPVSQPVSPPAAASVALPASVAPAHSGGSGA